MKFLLHSDCPSVQGAWPAMLGKVLYKVIGTSWMYFRKLILIALLCYRYTTMISNIRNMEGPGSLRELRDSSPSQNIWTRGTLEMPFKQTACVCTVGGNQSTWKKSPKNMGRACKHIEGGWDSNPQPWCINNWAAKYTHAQILHFVHFICINANFSIIIGIPIGKYLSLCISFNI